MARLSCSKCGHSCPDDRHCDQCGSDPMDAGDTRCAACDGGPGVPDPIADTARALAGLHADALSNVNARDGRERGLRINERRHAIEDAARACGHQVYAAFNALVTGDAGREVDHA